MSVGYMSMLVNVFKVLLKDSAFLESLKAVHHPKGIQVLGSSKCTTGWLYVLP